MLKSMVTVMGTSRRVRCAQGGIKRARPSVRVDLAGAPGCALSEQDARE